jgi:hypothetical protein
MERYDDATRLKIHATITTMVGGVAKEHASNRAMRHNVRHSGGDVVVAEARTCSLEQQSGAQVQRSAARGDRQG